MHTLWHDMFDLGLPIAEKIARPILVYLFLIVGLRLAGKRELAQLNPFDLVVLLTLSNTVQNAIIGNDTSVTGGVIGATTLLLVNYVLVRFVSRHEKLERYVEGDVVTSKLSYQRPIWPCHGPHAFVHKAPRHDDGTPPAHTQTFHILFRIYRDASGTVMRGGCR